MLESFAQFLVDTPINQWVASSTWLWPTMEILHFLGLSLLLGSLFIIDMRLAGHFKAMSLVATHKLLPMVFIGFGLNLTTGILFFLGDPTRYIINIGFQIKMILVIVAGVNAAVYYWKLDRDMQTLNANTRTPVLARTVAYTSLGVWTAVLLCGRLIPYVGTG
jgi:hypothetical protein